MVRLGFGGENFGRKGVAETPLGKIPDAGAIYDGLGFAGFFSLC